MMYADDLLFFKPISNPISISQFMYKTIKLKECKYLGVWISDDLTWTKHIESVCNRSRGLLGYIFRTLSPDSILHIYPFWGISA